MTDTRGSRDGAVLEPNGEPSDQSLPRDGALGAELIPPTSAATMNKDEIPRLTEHLFRHEAGKLVSIITGIFGADRLQLAEDVVQEALVRALQTWPYYGVPKNPAAWLTQTAKNLTLDVIRREKVFREKEAQIAPIVEQWSSGLEIPGSRSSET